MEELSVAMYNRRGVVGGQMGVKIMKPVRDLCRMTAFGFCSLSLLETLVNRRPSSTELSRCQCRDSWTGSDVGNPVDHRAVNCR
jgi:hypothetical protein